jgi:hypothetical protein
MNIKIFPSKRDMSAHLLEKVDGVEMYAEIDTNLTRWEAGKVVNGIALSLSNTKVNEGKDFIEIEGYTDGGAKTVVAAYKQGAMEL